MNKYVVNIDASPPSETGDMYPRSDFRDARDTVVLDSGYQSTGILDKYGNRIFRAPNEIRFNR